MVALGQDMAGLFTNKDDLAEQLNTISKFTHEPIWRLPITQEHRKAMEGKFSNLNNAGKGRYGGASKAAAFLEKFVEKEVEWAHIDIAG